MRMSREAIGGNVSDLRGCTGRDLSRSSESHLYSGVAVRVSPKDSRVSGRSGRCEHVELSFLEPTCGRKLTCVTRSSIHIHAVSSAVEHIEQSSIELSGGLCC